MLDYSYFHLSLLIIHGVTWRNMKACLPGWMDCPALSSIQRQRSVSSNQSFLCKVYWYEDTVMSFNEWSKFLKPLLEKRFIKAISCSKYVLHQQKATLRNSADVTVWPQIILTTHGRGLQGAKQQTYLQGSEKHNTGHPTAIMQWQKKTGDRGRRHPQR